MKVYTLLRRGARHPIYGQDTLFVLNTPPYHYAAVCDGCSTAPESHFASALFAKVARTVLAEMLPFEHSDNFSSQGLVFFQQFWVRLLTVQSQLQLDARDLLSTFVLLMYSEEMDETQVIALGDGVVAVDGKTHLLPAPPDYPAYYMPELFAMLDRLPPMELSKRIREWLVQHARYFVSSAPVDVGIATDGLLSFGDAGVKTLLTGPPPESQDDFERRCQSLEAAAPLNEDLALVRFVRP